MGDTRLKTSNQEKEDLFFSKILPVYPKGCTANDLKEIMSYREVSTIRLNPLAGLVAKVEEVLVSRGLELERVKWSPDTFIVKNKDKSELGKMQEYQKGLFYIQNLASMIPVIELQPQPSEKILDMAAAPGSKTTQIAAIMNNTGQIVANEVDYKRSRSLESILYQFHAKNVEVKCAAGQVYGEAMPHEFDRVLIDAPCSSEGIVNFAKPDPLKYWSPDKTGRMQKTQKELLRSAFKAVKKGGIVVYSTCTINRDENESVVEDVLSEFPEIEVQELLLPQDKDFTDFVHENAKGTALCRERRSLFPTKTKALRITPSAFMIGFFVMKFRSR